MEGEEDMEEEKKNVVNHFAAGSNCQVFNGSITGCVFAMPGSTVYQQPKEESGDEGHDQQTSDIPAVLADSEPWRRVQQAGLVDVDGQPTVSRPEAALIADMLAERLAITNKWKFFEQLWHRNNMRGDYNTALYQRKSLKFQERLKIILG